MSINKQLRQQRVRSKGRQISDRPRLCVNRSLRFLSAQIIDDKAGLTIAGVHEKQVSDVDEKDKLKALAESLAKQATTKGVKEVWFDRGERAYHGKLAEFADHLRKAGLVF